MKVNFSWALSKQLIMIDDVIHVVYFRYKPSPEDKLLKAFQVLDKDGKGYLTEEELTKCMTEEGTSVFHFVFICSGLILLVTLWVKQDTYGFSVVLHIHHPLLAGPRNFCNEALPHLALVFCILRA